MEVSTAELTGRWEIEVVPAEERMELTAGEDVLAPQCNSWCKKQESVVDARTGLPTATVTVETVHLAGENKLGVYTISMFRDALFGGLRLDESGEPFTESDAPNFWLEGLMTIKLRLRDADEIISLVSRQPVLQVGRAESWPPYNTVMRDVSGPNEYVPIHDRDGSPFLILWSGSITITDRISAFLSTDITVQSFEYLQKGRGMPVQGVGLVWNDERKKVPLIDHYHVFKRGASIHGDSGPWRQIGGCVKADSIVDPSFDGSGPTTYKVRQIFVDPLGDEVKGCGKETEFTVPALPANREQLVATGFWGTA